MTRTDSGNTNDRPDPRLKPKQAERAQPRPSQDAPPTKASELAGQFKEAMERQKMKKLGERDTMKNMGEDKKAAQEDTGLSVQTFAQLNNETSITVQMQAEQMEAALEAATMTSVSGTYADDAQKLAEMVARLPGQSQFDTKSLLLAFKSQGWPLGAMNISRDALGRVTVNLISDGADGAKLKGKTAELRERLEQRGITIDQVHLVEMVDGARDMGAYLQDI